MHVLVASTYYKSFEIGFINSLICPGNKVYLLLLHLMHAQGGSQLALKSAYHRSKIIFFLFFQSSLQVDMKTIVEC